MCWTDQGAQKTILRLKEDFNIRTFVETGTFKGVNALMQSYYFDEVLTCEVMPSYANESAYKLRNRVNARVYQKSSPEFLKQFVEDYKRAKRSDIVFIYLDAHFYDGKLPKEDRFVILKELKALRDFPNCIICVHDFDNKELGHITYDGTDLDFNLLKNDLRNVNSNFKYYTNTKESCDIIRIEDVKNGKVPYIFPDDETISNLEYAWSKPEKTYRGILYCTPKEVNLDGLKIIR